MSKTKRQQKKKKAREIESHTKVLKKRAIIREKAKLEKEIQALKDKLNEAQS